MNLCVCIDINQKDNASILEEVLVHTHLRFCCEVSLFEQHKHTSDILFPGAISGDGMNAASLVCFFLSVGSDAKNICHTESDSNSHFYICVVFWWG